MQHLPPALAGLAAYPQFVLWTKRPSPDGKITKLPANIHGQLVNAHDPQHWVSFDEAARVLPLHGPNHGIGFVLSDKDPYIFIDVDHALQADGSWSPLAQTMCQAFNGCAVEISQSGTGLHIIGRGTLRADHACKNVSLGLECYTTERFIALTGTNAVGNVDAVIAPETAAWLTDWYFKPRARHNDPDWRTTPVDDWRGPTDDDDLIRRACNSKSASAVFGGRATFNDLWSANDDVLSKTYPAQNSWDSYDRSSVDMALASHLAFWTGRNHERIEMLMRRSALVREKWDRTDYLPGTIAEACAMNRDVCHDKEPEAAPLIAGAGVTLQPASSITVQPIKWLWPGWLAQGKLTLLAGAAGTGKTTLALGLAAVVTSAGEWPDKTKCREAGNVLVWSGEDDPSDTLLPRLIACRANTDRVHFIRAMTDEKGNALPFDPARDVPALQRAVAALGGASLLMIDPVVSAVAGDMHKANEVRRGLQPVVDFAESQGCAVLGITHFSKGSAGTSPQERVIGSQAFGALARTVLVAAKQEDAEARVLARAKNNIGTDNGGVEYFIRPRVLFSHQGVETTCVEWGNILIGDARCLLGDVENPFDSVHTERDDAKRFLLEILANGPMPARQIKSEASDAGHSWITVRRAKDDLGVLVHRSGETGRQGGGAWVWELAAEGDDDD